jgi:hypothetical protein
MGAVVLGASWPCLCNGPAGPGGEGGGRGEAPPEAQGLVKPGRARARAPGAQGLVKPGRAGARAPGAQGLVKPGRARARAPGAQGLVKPGRAGARAPGAQGLVKPGRARARARAPRVPSRSEPRQTGGMPVPNGGFGAKKASKPASSKIFSGDRGPGEKQFFNWPVAEALRPGLSPQITGFCATIPCLSSVSTPWGYVVGQRHRPFEKLFLARGPPSLKKLSRWGPW